MTEEVLIASKDDFNFEEIVNKGLEEYFKQNPRIAVQFGKEEFEKVVESGTKEHIEEKLQFFSEWINKLKQLDITKLSFENRISLKVMVYHHDINLFMHETFSLWKRFPNGLEYFQEVLFLLIQRKGVTNDVAEAIIKHSTNLSKFIEEFQSRFDETPIPIQWRDLALEQIQTTPKILKNLVGVFSEKKGIKKLLRNDLLITLEAIKPVIEKHVEWIKNLPVDSDEFAWALGPENFKRLLELRKLPWDIETITKKGNNLFNSGFRKIKKIAKEVYPNKSLNEVFEIFFKEDQIMTFKDVLEYARIESNRASEFIKIHELATIPENSLKILETPTSLVSIIASAAYFPAPYYARDQPGVYVISPTQKERHSYTMISDWMIHEAFPGHHLDFISNNMFAPLIRLLPPIAYETVEGWALYCQEMMLKQNFPKNPIKTQQLASGVQADYAMHLNIDIQLHCKKRSIEEACKMVMNIMHMNEEAAKAAVIGHTMTPGYALSYLIGKLLIQELEQSVKEKMGDNFSLKFFHDTILRCGDLPYFLLKEYIEEKIKNYCES